MDIWIPRTKRKPPQRPHLLDQPRYCYLVLPPAPPPGLQAPPRHEATRVVCRSRNLWQPL
jgi:hypothetical protein